MLKKTTAIFFAIACPAFGQVLEQESSTYDDVLSQVRQIAKLSVDNTDSITDLRNRVQEIETGRPEILRRLTDLENVVFAVKTTKKTPTISTPVYSTPTISTPVYSTPTISTPTISTPVIYSTPKSNYGGPVYRRRMFPRLFGRRLTVMSSGRSGWVYPPRGLTVWEHLAGPPHFVDATGLSYSQAMDLHTRLH